MNTDGRIYVNAPQIRAARALLNWSQEDLASASNLSIATIRKLELGYISPRDKTIDAIISAMAHQNVEFTPSMGVRIRNNEIISLQGEDANLHLLDDIHDTMKQGEEILVWNADNSIPPEAVIKREIELRQCGINFRFLVKETDTYLHFPLEEYRWIPEKFYKNNVQVIYGHKVALATQQDRVTKHINSFALIESVALAESMRNAFNFVWDNCRKPTFSTAPHTYK